MRLAFAVIAAICAVCFSSHFAMAEKRVALVIGNSAYQHVPRLANPAGDAAAIGELFRTARFDVVEGRRDLGIVEMRRAVRDFSDKSRDADISVVYFAGHGIEVEGVNYLIPTDAVLERDRDAFDEAIQLDRVLQAVEPAKKMRLIILDACRDNPFQRTMKRAVATRALDRGLTTVEPTKPNTLIAFAAKGGSTADDGNGMHSPFTIALLRHLGTPGLELRKAFGLVRDDVMKATGNKQEPFVYGSLGGTDVALVPAASPGEAANQQAEVRRDYELAERIGTADVWDTFLKQYPTGLYSDFAKAQLRKLLAETARLNATDKARQVEAEKARLAAESAKAADQIRAAREAKAAEDARVAAEKLKLAEQQKAEAAERARAAVERAAQDKLAKERAEAEAKAVETARRAAEKARSEKTKLAALDEKRTAESEIAARSASDAAAKPSAADTSREKPAEVAALSTSTERIASTPQEIARSLQTELRRVGCQTSEVSDDWSATARRSLTLFNKHSNSKVDVKVASLDALDAVRDKTKRICPLTCEYGFKADGERCVKITCNAGSFINDDNECEKRGAPKKSESRLESKKSMPKETDQKIIASSALKQSSGQILCNKEGCRPVQKGCRVKMGYNGNQYEACY